MGPKYDGKQMLNPTASRSMQARIMKINAYRILNFFFLWFPPAGLGSVLGNQNSLFYHSGSIIITKTYRREV